MKLIDYISKRAAEDAAAAKAKAEAIADLENTVTELETEAGINGQ